MLPPERIEVLAMMGCFQLRLRKKGFLATALPLLVGGPSKVDGHVLGVAKQKDNSLSQRLGRGFLRFSLTQMHSCVH